MRCSLSVARCTRLKLMSFLLQRSQLHWLGDSRTHTTRTSDFFLSCYFRLFRATNKNVVPQTRIANHNHKLTPRRSKCGLTSWKALTVTITNIRGLCHRLAHILEAPDTRHDYHSDGNNVPPKARAHARTHAATASEATATAYNSPYLCIATTQRRNDTERHNATTTLQRCNAATLQRTERNGIHQLERLIQQSWARKAVYCSRLHHWVWTLYWKA